VATGASRSARCHAGKVPDTMLAPASPRSLPYWGARNDIDGALWDIDFLLIDFLLSAQLTDHRSGDLLEIGAMLGKSAILLGLNAGSGENVIVCDIFESEATDASNDLENSESYHQKVWNFNRAAFETNYRRWVGSLPTIVQELSGEIRQHVRDETLRFAHIDGSHLFDVVRDDIANVQPLMNPDGIVVFDDVRAIHTPGVAAAVWAAVADDGLIPVCLSEQKLYASWNASAAEWLAERMRTWIRGLGTSVNAGVQDVAGHELIIVANPADPPNPLIAGARNLIPPDVRARIHVPRRFWSLLPAGRSHLGRPL
jgi:hypothetical protein